MDTGGRTLGHGHWKKNTRTWTLEEGHDTRTRTLERDNRTWTLGEGHCERGTRTWTLGEGTRTWTLRGILGEGH